MSIVPIDLFSAFPTTYRNLARTTMLNEAVDNGTHHDVHGIVKHRAFHLLSLYATRGARRVLSDAFRSLPLFA